MSADIIYQGGPSAFTLDVNKGIRRRGKGEQWRLLLKLPKEGEDEYLMEGAIYCVDLLNKSLICIAYF
jgi:hypothetical protein